MAEKEPIIVIKKIEEGGHGHHGGAWKVALADLMTAMMAFFLVMWLLGQSEETKKAIAEYFSTPSVIEYNYSTFGAELTLEKLFLDFLNDPLKAIQSFVEPADMTPNILTFGDEKIIIKHMSDQLDGIAKNLVVAKDRIEFDIPDYHLFYPGTSDLRKEFSKVLGKVVKVTAGLEEANVEIRSLLFNQSVSDHQPQTANKVAKERLDLVQGEITHSLENQSTVSVLGKYITKNVPPEILDPTGLIKVIITRKESESANKIDRKELIQQIKKEAQGENVYEEFVRELVSKRKLDSGELKKKEVE